MHSDLVHRFSTAALYVGVDDRLILYRDGRSKAEGNSVCTTSAGSNCEIFTVRYLARGEDFLSFLEVE